MLPQPIPPSVVHVLLQYIAPPSELSQPIPPHLLSRSLLQRHHFLHLSPQDPRDYLCWPKSPEHQSLSIQALESLPRPIYDDEPVAYPVQYTSDGEYTYAHVDLSSQDANSARLIFQWDGQGEWKYHDANLMPFPPSSRPDIKDVSAHAFSDAIQDVQLHVPSLSSDAYSHAPYDKGNDSGDDDDYWNAYGAQDDNMSTEDDHSSGRKETGSGTEDAYWARYSSVHGTADSTQPSPLPQPHRKPHPVDADSTKESHPLSASTRSSLEKSQEDVLPIPHSAMLRPDLHSKWDPASPRTLTRLLKSISPRPSPSPSPALDPESAMLFGSEIASPTVGGSDGSSDSNTPSADALASQDAGMVPVRLERAPPPSALKLNNVAAGHFAVKQVGRTTAVEAIDAEEVALRAGIEGLWTLWKAGRRRHATTKLADDDDSDVFLRVVKDVVGSSYY